MTPVRAVSVLFRKAAAAGRRAEGDLAASRFAKADPTLLYGGISPYVLARRHAPAWPSARAPRDSFQRMFPAAAAYAIAEADHILEGRLRLFGGLENVSRGQALVDWEFRPKDERAASFGTDPKFPWEVARHAMLPRLGAAWYATRDIRYAERAALIVLDWAGLQARPKGLHWSSALEVGIRLIAWCQAFHFFRSSPPFKGPALDALLRHVASMAAWLEGHLSLDRVVAGNHLLGELAGLLVTDLYFPELGERERLGRNMRRFADQVGRQIAPDGVSLEQSSTYGRFVADFLAAVIGAARATNATVPDVVKSRGIALAGWLASLTREDGTLPLIGDNDSARGVDWGEPYQPNDARGVILALAALLDTPAPLRTLARGGYPPGSEIVFWWMGEEGVRRLAQLLEAAPPPRTLQFFPRGGHAVVRYGRGGREDFIHVRCGPFGHGLPKPSAHSHADWMSPVVVLNGVEVLVDPGNYGYTTVGTDRDLFRSDEAHNLFRVDDNPLAVPGGSFRWDDIPVRGRIDAEEDYREVRILGSWTPVVPTGGKVAVACRRALIYNKLQRFLSIGDEWSSKGPGPPRTITWRWHFPPETRITLQKGGAGLEAALPGGAVAVLEISPAADLEVREGWVAPVYSRRLPAPVVVVQRGSNGGEDRQSFRLAYRPPSGDVSA